MRTAIITGIGGQDGSYLAEFLLKKDYKVWGVYRRTSAPNFSRLEKALKSPNLKLIEGDICDPFTIARMVKTIKPDEYYNLAAQSHVATSFEQPSYTWDATGNAVLYALEAIRTENPSVKFYQASSSEMFGKNYTKMIDTDSGKELKKYQDETTPFYPQSPYAIAKLAGHHLVRNYRDSYGIYACSGILFNHESERRGDQFVTRKITKWLGEFLDWKNTHDENFEYSTEFPNHVIAVRSDGFVYGPQFPKLRLGNLDAYRDWGHAEDYIEAMWLMLQQSEPDDYVVSTGETHSVREFLEVAFGYVGLNYEDYVVVDPAFYRPAEVDYLLGSSTKAREKLQWEPKVSFRELVTRMVDSDASQARLRRSALQTV